METMQEINWLGKPQVDYQDHMPENKGIRGRVLYTIGQDGKMAYGGNLIIQLKTWADSHNIRLLSNHRVTRILKNERGEVAGVEADANGKTVTLRARKAVIFGTGGYTHNKDMMLHFQRGPHFGRAVRSAHQYRRFCQRCRGHRGSAREYGRGFIRAQIVFRRI